jgi:polyisoprenoid-binding protein YceI
MFFILVAEVKLIKQLMKSLMTGIAAILLLFAASCKDAPKADEAVATEPQEVAVAPTGAAYTVDLAKSKITWVGTKPTGRHHGTFYLKAGNIVVANNSITGGNFVIDVTNITAFDEDNSANAKLQKHLTSADFFEVDKFPEATFEITDVQEGVNKDNVLVMKEATHTVTGNLTMKAISKSISFPAKIEMNDAGLTAHAEFNIDRTQWGIVYHSDKSVGEKFINPEVNLTVHLEAMK